MQKKKISLINIILSLIPFVLLIIIGLIPSKMLFQTYHQKIFKTLLIFISNCTLLFFILLKVASNKKGIEKERKYLMYFLLYFIFILIQFIVSFLSKEISYDREYYIGNYTFLIIFSLFFYLYLNDFEDFKIGLLIICFFFAILTIYSIIEFFIYFDQVKIEIPDITFIKALNKFRPKLTFGNTNYLAGYIIGLIPVSFCTALVWLINRKKSILKLIIGLSALVYSLYGIIPLYFTQTRGAWLGCYLGIFLIFLPSLFLMNHKITKKISIPIAIIIIIIFIALPIFLFSNPNIILQKFFPRVVRTYQNLEYFLKDRTDNGWAGGLSLFKRHPIFGAGLGTVYPASFKYTSKLFFLYSKSNSFKHSHGEYAEILGEAGIFGMIFFISLVGFVIFMLMKNTYQKKYNYKYRLICLGISTGLISMLIHQIFSLTLRMSVTMSTFFFLLGIGIFTISIAKKALVEKENKIKSKKKKNENKFLNFLNTMPNQSESYFILAIIGILLTFGLTQFLPLLRSEHHIYEHMKSLSNISTKYEFDKSEALINKAIKLKPDNVYAWNKKWEFHISPLSKSVYGDEKSFELIEYDLNKLNSIIPGYQEVWAKYSDLYIQKYSYSIKKYYENFDEEYFIMMKESQKKSLEYLNKSINMNFLRLTDHIYRMIFINMYKDKEALYEAVGDYLTAKIYLEFAKKRKIIKEKIEIKISDKNNIELKNKIYYFELDEDDIIRIRDLFLGIGNITSQQKFQEILDYEADKILTELYSKIDSNEN